MSNALTVLADKMAVRFGLTPDGEVLDVLKLTAFKGEVSDAQMTALLVVANQYGLNPWTKEIYAFPDKRGGIVPVVGVDGWARIINDHTQFDGMDFDVTDDSVTCAIYRKDRSHPIRITEYLSECARPTDPWKTHPRRMLRHKAMIQCARLAFGFVGIYEQDEAERIIAGTIDATTGEIHPPAQSLQPRRKSENVEDAKVKTPTANPPADTINAGQVKYLGQKIDAIGLDQESVDAMCKRLGITAIDTGMSIEQFNALKTELLNAGA